MYSIGIDIGGTFTDFTVYDAAKGRLDVEKCLSTPQNPEQGVLAGLDLLAQRIPGLLAGAAMLALSFLGFDAISTLSEEARDPERTVPRAIILTTIITIFVVIAGWEVITYKPSVYLAAFLIMEGVMVGVFSALDAMLFYVFWEAMLIPSKSLG